MNSSEMHQIAKELTIAAMQNSCVPIDVENICKAYKAFYEMLKEIKETERSKGVQVGEVMKKAEFY